MRKGKRFTPSLLNNWKQKGRGEGVGADYTAWHSITRGDPGSLGKSRIQNNNLFNRSMDYLSDSEFATFCFMTMLPDVHDVREQYPLCLDEHPCDISKYLANKLSISSQGTLKVAEGLGFSHPVVKKGAEKVYWSLTTDLLITINHQQNGFKLVAISVKDISPSLLSERQKELLAIERQYWASQGVSWLLITPEVFCKSVVATLKSYAAYAISDTSVGVELITAVTKFLPHIDNMPLSKALKFIEINLEISQSIAQKIFWQGVWKGLIPINLRRKVTPFTPIHLISHEDFWQQNPIAVGRTSCFQ